MKTKDLYEPRAKYRDKSMFLESLESGFDAESNVESAVSHSMEGLSVTRALDGRGYRESVITRPAVANDERGGGTLLKGAPQFVPGGSPRERQSR